MKQTNNNQCCAYRIYPEPAGTYYFQQDLNEFKLYVQAHRDDANRI